MDLETYVCGVDTVINKLRRQLRDLDPNDKETSKSLRNRISAYESRKAKRIAFTELREEVEKKDDKMTKVVDVLRDELTGKVFRNVMARLK